MSNSRRKPNENPAMPPNPKLENPLRAQNHETAPPAQMEFLLGGRRYHLVPVDEIIEGSDQAAKRGAVKILTGRELQIVALVAEGRVNKQIAELLRISEWTVGRQISRIFDQSRVGKT